MATGKVQFVVTVEGTEPPPDWAMKVQRRLERELELSFGRNVSVALVPELPSLTGGSEVPATERTS